MRKTKILFFNSFSLIIVGFLYFANNIYIKKIEIEFLYEFSNYYFNDMICPMALMSLTNLFLMFYIPLCTKLFKNYPTFLNRLKHGFYDLHRILVYCFLCGIYWEFIYPKNHSDSTSDIMDIACYLIGGLMYYISSKIVIY